MPWYANIGPPPYPTFFFEISIIQPPQRYNSCFYGISASGEAYTFKVQLKAAHTLLCLLF